MKGLTDLQRYLGLVPANKPKPLQKLNTRHRQIILLHLEGMEASAISDEIGCHPSTVRRVLQDNQAQEIISDYFDFADSELRALFKMSIQAVRNGLTNPDVDVQMRAADKVFKVLGKYAPKDTGGATAEDVVRRIMELKITEEVPVASRNQKRSPKPVHTVVEDSKT